MDILIESTKKFEKDITQLNETEKTMVINAINHCSELFIEKKSILYRKLKRVPFNELGKYSSSLYKLKVSRHLSIILTVDEDPIFQQVIFTLFRVVKQSDIEKAYRGIVESLYQGFLHTAQETSKNI